MTAFGKISSGLAQDTKQALPAIEAYAQAFPDATIYEIETELEAAQILLSMAAMIKRTARSVKNKVDRNTYLEVASNYRRVVNQGKALETFANMTEADQLELYGLTLVARRRTTMPANDPKIITEPGGNNVN